MARIGTNSWKISLWVILRFQKGTIRTRLPGNGPLKFVGPCRFENDCFAAPLAPLRGLKGKMHMRNKVPWGENLKTYGGRFLKNDRFGAPSVPPHRCSSGAAPSMPPIMTMMIKMVTTVTAMMIERGTLAIP